MHYFYSCINLPYMKSLIPFIVMMISISARAQTALDSLTEPCGKPISEYLDLNNDQINDMELTGFNVGTDDFPSSSGYCSLGVRVFQNTFILFKNVLPGNQYYEATAGEEILVEEITKQVNAGALEWNTNVYANLIDWPYGSEAEKNNYAIAETSILIFKTVTEKEEIFFWVKFLTEPMQGITIIEKGVAKNGVLKIAN